MISISEYLNENLDEFVFELKNQTYLNAYKKAKKLNDPRAEKFLQAFKDNMDNELIDEINSDKENEFNTYYNADKKSIVRLKKLIDKNHDPNLNISYKGSESYLHVFSIDSDLSFIADVSVINNKDRDKQIFLRPSLIKKENWSNVSRKFNEIGEKLNNLESDKSFVYVQLFTNSSSIYFFYIIDTDDFIPVLLISTLGDRDKRYRGEKGLDYYTDNDKDSINAVCKAINQNHKDI